MPWEIGLTKPISILLDLIYPPNCLSCNSLIAEASALCAECWQKISFITHPLCEICGLPFDYDLGSKIICGDCTKTTPLFTKARCVFSFDEHSKKLIHDFKYHDKTYLAPYFAKLLNQIGQEILKDADFLIPVPISLTKLLARLYNQSALLSLYLEKISQVKFLPHALIKSKNTKTQTGLSRKQRLSNVLNSFKINKNMLKVIKNKNIVLIDDVITSKATIHSCTKELLTHGLVAKVSVLTVARKIY